MIELTPADRELLALTLSVPDDEVAQRMGLAVQTVKNRRALLYARLGVAHGGRGKRHSLLDAAKAVGWLTVPELT